MFLCLYPHTNAVSSSSRLAQAVVSPPLNCFSCSLDPWAAVLELGGLVQLPSSLTRLVPPEWCRNSLSALTWHQGKGLLGHTLHLWEAEPGLSLNTEIDSCCSPHSPSFSLEMGLKLLCSYLYRKRLCQQILSLTFSYCLSSETLTLWVLKFYEKNNDHMATYITYKSITKKHSAKMKICL